MAGRKRNLEATLRALAEKPSTVNMKVTITGGKPEFGAERAANTPPHIRRALRTLGRSETKILDWLEADPANAAAFLADPVKALRGSGIAIDRAALGTLAATSREGKLPPGVKLGKVSAAVRREPLR